MKKIIKGILFSSLFFLILPKVSLAYLDAGSGSYVIQIVIAILAGGAFAIKIFFRQIKRFFTKVFSRKDKNDK
ncbi:MAG: hypothetical protein U5L76_04880 [Patescibacteria group bacterium]|nr:hypothetical protein [Patescibacteria group bacterium]